MELRGGITLLATMKPGDLDLVIALVRDSAGTSHPQIGPAVFINISMASIPVEPLRILSAQFNAAISRCLLPRQRAGSTPSKGQANYRQVPGKLSPSSQEVVKSTSLPSQLPNFLGLTITSVFAFVSQC